MKRILAICLCALTFNGCLGGSSYILGALPPQFNPIGRWLVPALENALGLDVSEKLDSAKKELVYQAKQYVDDQLSAVAPHTGMVDDTLLMAFSRKNKGELIGKLYPVSFDSAMFLILSDTGVVYYPVVREISDEQLKESLMKQEQIYDKLDEIKKALKKKKGP